MWLSNTIARCAILFENYTPSVEDLTSNLPQGWMDFKWSNPMHRSVHQNLLSCYQTSLPLAALPLWWWYLNNCTNATCHRGKTKHKHQQHLANQSITLSFWPKWQTAGSWILFNLGVMPLDEKAKAAWPLQVTTLRWQVMIIRRSSEWQAFLKPTLIKQSKTYKKNNNI